MSRSPWVYFLDFLPASHLCSSSWTVPETFRLSKTAATFVSSKRARWLTASMRRDKKARRKRPSSGSMLSGSGRSATTDFGERHDGWNVARLNRILRTESDAYSSFTDRGTQESHFDRAIRTASLTHTDIDGKLTRVPFPRCAFFVWPLGNFRGSTPGTTLAKLPLGDTGNSRSVTSRAFRSKSYRSGTCAEFSRSDSFSFGACNDRADDSVRPE
jgi:hypothetical protein